MATPVSPNSWPGRVGPFFLFLFLTQLAWRIDCKKKKELAVKKKKKKKKGRKKRAFPKRAKKRASTFGKGLGCVWLVRSRTGSNSWCGAASCQPNATPETEHIFVEKCAKLGAFFKMCMDHHGHFVRYDESNPKAYARDHLGTKSMFPPGFTVKK